METYLDIIRVLSAGEQGPTHIMYKANLSWLVLQEYLKKLEGLGLIEGGMVDERRIYKITQKGFDLLRQYLSMRENLIQ